MQRFTTCPPVVPQVAITRSAAAEVREAAACLLLAAGLMELANPRLCSELCSLARSLRELAALAPPAESSGDLAAAEGDHA